MQKPILCINDWMNIHNIPDNLKIGRFYITIVGEARLWYESLQPIANDWPAFQNQFRQQYSKIGNTREQLFYAWRSFHYENVETVDVYVNRIRQVVAMLGYGDPQILEVFKYTVPSKLYWILYAINDLRVAVETAQSVLTKEKMDKQRRGQSSTSPFMKASQESKRCSEKVVTFDALGTIERNSDSIDKLTSLVNKMNIKMAKKEPLYKPRVYQGRNRGSSYRQDNYRSRERSYSRDHAQYRGRGNYSNRGYRSNYRARSRPRSRNDYGNRRNDRFVNRQSYRRDNFRQDHREQRYRARSISQGQGRSREQFRDISRCRDHLQR